MDIEAWVCEVPLREPLRISAATYHTQRSIVLRLRDGDLEGWGEACQSRRVLGESFEDALESLRASVDAIKRAEYDSLEKIHRFTEELNATPSIKAAVNMALLDLYAKSEGRPLWRLLGGFREEVRTDITIGIMRPEEMAERALRYAEKGFRIFKLKLGENPEEDVLRVKAVRDVVGDATIRVDANEGWTREDAVRVIERIADYGVELVEQPLRHDDIEGLRALRRESPIPIAVDESVKTARDALLVAKKEAADIINIKLMKSRGITGAIRIIMVSEAAGLKNMVGCFSESRLGITATAYLAQAFSNVLFYDLDCDILSADPVFTGGSEPIGDRRRASPKPGLGISPSNFNVLKKIL
ncbi:dipeptide epimerase [Thermofilum pendens]|uniref:Mandelate racemase/muconate lactonizing enzyme, C-terminal domain protein n=1 Tax=Thermofilum pendens (strain DSM 2475 / Hrk 5) TaxID=368408 RepID=A1S1A2_THEPD|nr:dipeptide epimerase [Thermofilum pendens]ABL79232.1 Mandelate racemase/muconate lactonizing enzyme, C-terminal domain protein [Thermofilum pendens Hrk 5]